MAFAVALRLLIVSAMLLASCGQILIPKRTKPASSDAPARDLRDIERPAVSSKARPIAGFMRGINLGNGLDAPREGAWGVVLDEQHFAMAEAAGLDHVRLPVRFSAHAGDDPPYTVDEEFFKRVDWAIERALAHRLSVIVDLHHYEEIMKAPEENAARLLGIWSQIALRYKDRPRSVAFELLNEPSDKLTSDKLNPLMARVVEVVRAHNPTRLVFVDGYFWANAEYLHQLVLPEDANVIPSFHMYQPILFTHQGASWMGPEYQTLGVVFPGPPATPITPVGAAQQTPWVRGWFEGYNHLPLETNPGGPSTVFAHFGHAERYVAKTGKRMYLGEFGAIANADPQSRVSYLRLVRQEAERYGFGWAYWDDGGKNQGMVVSNRTWVPAVKSALFE